ncbi:MAG: MarR family transcriptional regulator [Lactobacillaceae bacterium]|nr:MarR family transcriptional regulator [Lactobacillaceae bacterium]
MVLLEEYIEAYLSTIKYLDDVVSEPAAEFDLSFEQYLIMHKVANGHNVTLSDIVDERQVTRAAISRQIKMLVKKEYVTQEIDPIDRRRLFLRLTDAGYAVEAIVAERVETKFNQWMDSFGERQARYILGCINQFDAAVVSKTRANLRVVRK